MEHKINLGEKTVSDVRKLLVEQPSVIGPDEPVENVLRKINEDPRTRHVYVIDSEEKMIGSVRMNKIVEYLFPFTAMMEKSEEIIAGSFTNISAKKVSDIMDEEPIYVGEDTTLAEASGILMREEINELPVIDINRRIIGQINVYEIIQAYLNIVDQEGEETF